MSGFGRPSVFKYSRASNERLAVGARVAVVAVGKRPFLGPVGRVRQRESQAGAAIQPVDFAGLGRDPEGRRPAAGRKSVAFCPGNGVVRFLFANLDCEVLRATAFEVDSIDESGAGDAFTAGFMRISGRDRAVAANLRRGYSS